MSRWPVVLSIALALGCDGAIRFDEPDAAAPFACKEAADCPGAAPVCAPGGRCVQCTSDQDCPSGLACEVTLGQCNARCHDEPDCPASTPTCDESHGVCAFCTTSDICAYDEPICDPDAGLCRPCTADSECLASRPHCTASGECVHCLTSADCAANQHCDLDRHDCE